jgi:hypothetical protein
MSKELYKEYERLRALADVEWQKKPLDWNAIELLEAQCRHAFMAFEDKVWIECRLPRHELLMKRANFG